MKEIRSIDGAEFRIAPETRKIEGYAILFNQESNDLGGFKEVILPESVNGVLERSDVLALYNHDDDKVLARNTAGKGTLGLEIDEKGVKYSFSAPKTPVGDEVFDAINRGDLRNSSFAFTVADGGQKWEKRGDSFIRSITQFDKIYDVSPVYRPAYSDTTVALRSLDDIKIEFNALPTTTCEPELKLLPTTTMEPDDDIDMDSEPVVEENLDEYFNELDESIEALKK